MPTAPSAGGASLALQGMGLASSAIGSYYTTRTQRLQMQMAARIDQANARISETQAENALEQGNRAEESVMLRTAQIKSEQRAAMGANGVDMSDGSAARVLTSTDTMGAIDKETVARNAMMSAWGYRMQGSNYSADAAMKEAGAKSLSPGMAVASTLLGGSGEVANNWYQMSRLGAIGGPSSVAPSTGSVLFVGDANVNMSRMVG